MLTLQTRVGAQIRAIRTVELYTQEEISELAGITQGHYGAIERGISWPSGDVMDKIAGALGVNPGDFFSPGPEHSKIKEIHAILLSFTPKQLDLARRLIREIAK